MTLEGRDENGRIVQVGHRSRPMMQGIDVTLWTTSTLEKIVIF